MDIAVIRKRPDNLNLRQNIVQNIAERFQQQFSINDNATETLILPVVPEGLEFPRSAEITNLKGVTTEYNIPKRTNLHSMTIESVFPVNKSYSWIKTGANQNGYDYVDFFDEVRDGEKPFRLLAYSVNTPVNLVAGEIAATAESGGFDIEQNGAALFKVHCDKYFLVKKFKYKLDKAGDINYTLEIEQFNETEQDKLPLNWSQAGANALLNVTVRSSLKLAGLI